MEFIPLRGWGKDGVIQDTPAQAIPVSAFSDALNVRFSGGHIEKMLESAPVVADPAGNPSTLVTGTDCQFCITWTDGFSSYLAAVFAVSEEEHYVFRWDQRTEAPDANNPARWEIIGGPYKPGVWQGFQWGDTIILNNGTTAPQIFNRDTISMQDLPNWGFISNAEDITNVQDPSINTRATCRWIGPLGPYLVALNVTEQGNRAVNKTWWSDPAAAASIEFAPSWDYVSPITQSGQAEVGVGSGSIITAERLNSNLIIYTDTDCTAMSIVGGRFVMQFRRLFNKGAAGMHCVAEFENKHFVVARDQIYIHDGSTPVLIAQDRVEREFFRRIGKRDSISAY